MGFHRTVYTQAGYSFLFLLLKYHKDTFYHPHYAAQAFLQSKHYNDKPHRFYHQLLEVQIAHYTDSIHILHPYHVYFCSFQNIAYSLQFELTLVFPFTNLLFQ